MIIRAWVEPGSTDPLRAQLRITTDVANGIERTLTLSRAEAVSDTVQEWLAEIMAHAEPPNLTAEQVTSLSRRS